MLFVCDFDFNGWMAVSDKKVKSKLVLDKVKFKLDDNFSSYCDELSGRSSLASLVKSDEFLDNLHVIKDKFKGKKLLNAVFTSGKFIYFK